MRKKKVDCPGISKAIRKEYNDIVWVSASIDGSRLKIQIKENEDTFQEEVQGTEEVSEKPTDLIAEEDGVITGIITRSGVPQVHIGDSVKKGRSAGAGKDRCDGRRWRSDRLSVLSFGCRYLCRYEAALSGFHPSKLREKELQREIAVSVLHEDRELGDPGRYFEESVSAQ